jgi:hypothetical protein
LELLLLFDELLLLFDDALDDDELDEALLGSSALPTMNVPMNPPDGGSGFDAVVN